MKTALCAIVTCLMLVGLPALAQPVIDGSAADVMYGSSIADQNTQTGFGDSDLGRPGLANGSELDAAYAVVYGDTLYLVLAGNLQTNGNQLEVFFDTIPIQGQNQLGAQNPDIDFGALQRMGYLDEENPGLKFAAGFNADYYLTIEVSGDPPVIDVGYAELYVDEMNPGVGYYLGQGATTCDTNGGELTGGDPGAPFSALCTIDNRNVDGVDGGFGVSSGAGVITGCELAIPLSALGNPGADFTVCAFINGQQHDFVSNQLLGGILAVPTDNLGEPRQADFTTTFHQPFSVTRFSDPLGACCALAGGCEITTELGCDGEWQGANVSCDTYPCDPGMFAGACCIENTCSLMTGDDCAAAGGMYLGDGTDCIGCPCPIYGACCVADDDCQLLDEETCIDPQGLAGDWIGPYTTCETDICQPGACCHIVDEVTVCDVMRAHDCAELDGDFLGPGTTCDGDPCNPAIENPHVAGSLQGWDPTSDPMTETEPGSGIWERAYTGLDPLARHEFKITNGLGWDDPGHESFPESNSWLFTDAVGDITITYDANLYLDGWAPNINRLGLSADPGTWTAAGSFQSEVGGNDWDNASPVTQMLPQGGGIYLYEATGIPTETYSWKAVITGSWDSISWDGRSINTGDMQFVIGSTADTMRLYVDALAGRVKVEIEPGVELCPGDMDCDGDIDFDDINPFVLALGGEAGYLAQYPDCLWLNGDTDGDEDVDFDDINPFVGLIGTTCP